MFWCVCVCVLSDGGDLAAAIRGKATLIRPTNWSDKSFIKPSIRRLCQRVEASDRFSRSPRWKTPATASVSNCRPFIATARNKRTAEKLFTAFKQQRCWICVRWSLFHSVWVLVFCYDSVYSVMSTIGQSSVVFLSEWYGCHHWTQTSDCFYTFVSDMKPSTRRADGSRRAVVKVSCAQRCFSQQETADGARGSRKSLIGG